MYNIEIRGNNLQELYANAVNLVVLLARGGNTVMTPNAPKVPDTVNETPVVKSDPPPVDPTPQATAVVMEPVADASKRKPGRPRAPQTIEATATEVKPDDGVPDFLQRMADGDKAKVVEVTLDLDKDIRPRIREINAAHVSRSLEAGAKKSAADIAGVEYCKKLFAEFGIVKTASELPVTKYAEFIARSQAYLDGTA